MIEVRDLGLKFFKNPSTAFTLRGYYHSFFDRKYYNESSFRWVWRHLNFDLVNGDVVAILGRNGEGKTTLLRTLAGLIRPDEGAIRCSSTPYLLSAGLGLRDELSGFENIKLGGLFLGLSRSELRRLTPVISDFAELSDDDLNKPMKYYSDGMRSRLVFSLATCKLRDILFLDEILGAGDRGFQEKASTRMQELIKSAKLIVMVSHSSEFVRETATKSLVLHNGCLDFFGDVNEGIARYESLCGRSN